MKHSTMKKINYAIYGGSNVIVLICLFFVANNVSLNMVFVSGFFIFWNCFCMYLMTSEAEKSRRYLRDVEEDAMEEE
jgi:hypothetical protein